MMGVNGASKIPANCVCVVCDLHVAVFLKTDREQFQLGNFTSPFVVCCYGKTSLPGRK